MQGFVLMNVRCKYMTARTNMHLSEMYVIVVFVLNLLSMHRTRVLAWFFDNLIAKYSVTFFLLVMHKGSRDLNNQKLRKS